MKSKDIKVGETYLISETGTWPCKRKATVTAIGVERETAGAWRASVRKDGIAVTIKPTPKGAAFAEFKAFERSIPFAWRRQKLPDARHVVVRAAEVVELWTPELEREIVEEHEAVQAADARHAAEREATEKVIARAKRYGGSDASVTTGWGNDHISIDVATLKRLLDAVKQR